MTKKTRRWIDAGLKAKITLEAPRGHRQLESAMGARNTPLGFSFTQIATLVLEIPRQTGNMNGAKQGKSTIVVGNDNSIPTANP